MFVKIPNGHSVAQLIFLCICVPFVIFIDEAYVTIPLLIGGAAFLVTQKLLLVNQYTHLNFTETNVALWNTTPALRRSLSYQQTAFLVRISVNKIGYQKISLLFTQGKQTFRLETNTWFSDGPFLPAVFTYAPRFRSYGFEVISQNPTNTYTADFLREQIQNQLDYGCMLRMPEKIRNGIGLIGLLFLLLPLGYWLRNAAPIAGYFWLWEFLLLLPTLFFGMTYYREIRLARQLKQLRREKERALQQLASILQKQTVRAANTYNPSSK